MRELAAPRVDYLIFEVRIIEVVDVVCEPVREVGAGGSQSVWVVGPLPGHDLGVGEFGK